MKAKWIIKSTLMITALCLIAIPAIAQSSITKGESKSVRTELTGSAVNPETTMQIPIDLIAEFAWVATETEMDFQNRLNKNLKNIGQISGVKSAEFNQNENELSVTFENGSPDASAFIKQIEGTIIGANSGQKKYDNNESH